MHHEAIHAQPFCLVMNSEGLHQKIETYIFQTLFLASLVA